MSIRKGYKNHERVLHFTRAFRNASAKIPHLTLLYPLISSVYADNDDESPGDYPRIKVVRSNDLVFSAQINELPFTESFSWFERRFCVFERKSDKGKVSKIVNSAHLCGKFVSVSIWMLNFGDFTHMNFVYPVEMKDIDYVIIQQNEDGIVRRAPINSELLLEYKRRMSQKMSGELVSWGGSKSLVGRNLCLYGRFVQGNYVKHVHFSCELGKDCLFRGLETDSALDLDIKRADRDLEPFQQFGLNLWAETNYRGTSSSKRR